MKVEDRYTRSVTSSHLEVDEFSGDIDALIAAGWVRESLSTMLWRLRVEFDSVDKQALGRSNCQMTDRLLALAHMRGLHPAKEALGRFVMGEATRRGLGLQDGEARRVSGRVLNHFLDPLCPACRGVKWRTVPGTGRLSGLLCDACDGSGRDRLRFADGCSHDEVRFTYDVLAELDRKMDRIRRLMQRFLREPLVAM